MATASAVPTKLILANFHHPTTYSRIKFKSFQTPLRILSQKSPLSSNGVQIKKNFVEKLEFQEMGVKRIGFSRRVVVRYMGSDSSVASTGLPNKAQD